MFYIKINVFNCVSTVRFRLYNLNSNIIQAEFHIFVITERFSSSFFKATVFIPWNKNRLPGRKVSELFAKDYSGKQGKKYVSKKKWSAFFTPRNGKIVGNPPWTALFWKISIFTELINLHGTISSLVVSGFHNTRDTGPPLGPLTTYNNTLPSTYDFSFIPSLSLLLGYPVTKRHSEW